MSVTTQHDPATRDAAQREAPSIFRRNIVAAETVASLPTVSTNGIDTQNYNRMILFVDLNDSTYCQIITYWWDGVAWFEGASKTTLLDDAALVVNNTGGRIMWAIPRYLTTGTTAMTGAVADDGGVQTDETTEANSAAANDMTLLPVAPVQNDAYYFADSEAFGLLRLNIGTQGAGAWTITWEYYTGTAWAALSGVTDGTTGFTAAVGNRDVTFTVPSDWASTTVGGIAGFFIRARVSAFTNIVTQPLGTQSWVVRGVTFSYAPY